MIEHGCSQQWETVTLNDNRLRPTSFFSVYQIRSLQFVMRTANSKSELSVGGPLSLLLCLSSKLKFLHVNPYRVLSKAH